MRILLVIEFFVPSTGGSVDSVYHLAKHLARRGHRVTVCTSDFHERHESVLPGEGFEVVTFGTAFQLASFYVTPALVPWIARNLKHYDVVHLNNFRSFQNAVASRFAVRYGIPYLLSPRGAVPRAWGREKLKAQFDAFFGRYIMEHATLVNALSQAEEEQHLVHWVPRQKVAIVPNGIDLSRYEKLPLRGGFRQRFGIAPEEKLVLYFGRLHPRKGLDLLVRAFASLSRRMAGVRLALAGPDDGHQQTLAALARELEVEQQVLFTGYIPDKVQPYVDADVHVQPAVDIFNRTVLEAWACGTPVIVTRQCRLMDWNGSGAIVADGEEEGLAAAMCRVLGDEAESERLSQEGRRMVEQFSIERVAEQMEGVYLQMLGVPG